ncbi:hypothetical protein [Dysgonomonas alginatilytica]|nr:hypothetical protein [Dysgonomonas alginatilytica]
MKFYFLTLITLVSFSLVSCNDDSGNGQADIIYLPGKIINKSLEEGYEGSATLYFRYDKENRVTYIIQSMNEAPAEEGDTLSFAYDTEGRLSSVVTLFDTTKFTYNSNKVYCVQNNADTYYRDTLELGSSGELLKLYSAEYLYTYEYDWKGNLTKYIGTNTVEGQTSITTLTYDDKNGLFKNIKTPSWYFIKGQGFPLCFMNNTLQELHADGSADTFTCKYNDVGYPVSVEVDGENKFLLTVEYITVNK